MRVDRLLSMLLIISKKGRVTGKELSEYFEVSLRTIYRDIDKLGEAGIPIASMGGRGGGYYVINNYNVEHLFLKKEEASTFMAIVDNLSFLFGKNANFNDMALKIENTYRQILDKEKLSINMSHFSMEDELKNYLIMMIQAIEHSKLLIFDYSNRRMNYSERIVEPAHITFSAGQWYLSAFCRNRQEYRRFKLVRISNLKTGDGFKKREILKEEIEKIFEKSYLKQSMQVTLKFSNRMGEQLTEYFQKENIQKTEDNHYMVIDRFPYEEGLLKFILSFGKECEIVEPNELRVEFKDYIKDLVSTYNG